MRCGAICNRGIAEDNTTVYSHPRLHYAFNLRLGLAHMVSEFEKGLADFAQGEFDKFHGFEETDPPLAGRIKFYWTSLGKKFPGVGTAWSAVFVSACLKAAGATKNEFLFSEEHSQFVFWAIHNTETISGLFRGHPIEEIAPSVGDIIHLNRPNKKITYQFAASHKDYPSHSAIVVATGQDSTGHFAMTIGGNEGAPGMVGRRRVILNDEGFIVQNPTRPYISVIQNLK